MLGLAGLLVCRLLSNCRSTQHTDYRGADTVTALAFAYLDEVLAWVKENEAG
jgi:hypothetical protein